MDEIKIIRCKNCAYAEKFLADEDFLCCTYWTDDTYTPVVPINGYCHNAINKEVEL